MCSVKGCPQLPYCDQRTRNGYRVTLLHCVLLLLLSSTVKTGIYSSYLPIRRTKTPNPRSRGEAEPHDFSSREEAS